MLNLNAKLTENTTKKAHTYLGTETDLIGYSKFFFSSDLNQRLPVYHLNGNLVNVPISFQL